MDDQVAFTWEIKLHLRGFAPGPKTSRSQQWQVVGNV